SLDRLPLSRRQLQIVLHAGKADQVQRRRPRAEGTEFVGHFESVRLWLFATTKGAGAVRTARFVVRVRAGNGDLPGLLSNNSASAMASSFLPRRLRMLTTCDLASVN